MPTFLSTHPAVPDRIAALEEAIRNGDRNICDRGDTPATSCGLNNSAYQRRVRDRLALRD